jgi:hypothetical protein
VENCREVYDSIGAEPCIDYGFFADLACEPSGDDDMYDEGCYAACLETLREDEFLCFDITERCYRGCSIDDNTGCANMYGGAAGGACMTYEEYFIAACDPRGDRGAQNCAASCFEDNGADCEAMDTCLSGC